MKKQLESFCHAFEGLWQAIRTEAHLRFHLVAGFYVFLFAFLGEFSANEWAVLILTVCSVITAELVNTAVEDLCDLYSTEENKKIKRIKDISAGAVLCFSLGAVGIALCLFIFTGKLEVAFGKLLSSPLWFIPLGASAVLSILFITLVKEKTEHKD